MKFYNCFMSHLLYHLGDIASKPMSWGWLDGDNWIDSKTGSIIYSTYNYLMLKSCYFNDKSDCDVWRDAVPGEDEDDEDDDKFTPITFKKDENKL